VQHGSEILILIYFVTFDRL